MRAVPPEVLAACKEERRAERTVALQIADAGQRGHALQRIKPCVTVIETEAPAADPSAREDAWAITKHAAAAARAGDCMTVIADEDVVREIDAEFHATIFVRDVAIAGCLQPATP